jgi:lipoprotein NlpD
MTRLLRLLAWMLLALSLAACAPRTSVKVQRADAPRPAPARPPIPAPAAGDYLVQRGDTLYGIAFRHGMDYRQLAAINGIAPPYTIYPGQRVRLDARARPSTPAPPTEAPATAVVAPIVRDDPVAPPVPPPSAAAADATAAAPPVQATPAPGPAPMAASPPPLPAGAPSRWRWPAEGALVASFAPNDPTRQGLAIAGSAGQPVRAAADGVVVYSGSGLIGYGELIIVKHSDEWLSAYGHNRKRLVAEGQAVQAGEQIAEMGRSGASRDMLHFEIRRNGRPVDPQGLLPRRP